MSVAIAFPTKENVFVKEYVKVVGEKNKGAPRFADLLNAVDYLENLLEQSGKDMAEMKRQLDELTEIRKNPIRAALGNIYTTMRENFEAAKSRLGDIVESIVNFCKRTLENFKVAGVTALDKTASFLHLKDGLDAISNLAAKNNELCGQAINKIAAFSAEYHKTGLSLKNMGRIAFGKEPIETAKENGKLAAVMYAPYHAAKAVWAKIDRTAYILARNLDDFHSRAQIDKETAKTQRTDVFKTVEKHKEAVGTAKRDKSRAAKKSRNER